MDTAATQLFLQFLKDQRLIQDYAYLAPAALLIYDYVLTIYTEITLVWFSPWTHTKVLFLLARYIPMSNIYISLHDQLVIDPIPELCSKSRSANTWLLITGIISAEIILMIRTWAVWHKDWRIGIFLVAIVAGAIISSSINASQFLKSLESVPPPYPGYRGCFVSGNAKSLLQAFITLGVMDAAVLGLMMISAFRTYRSGDKNELSNMVHRDAIEFYIYMLVCSIANVIVARVWPRTLMILLTPLQSTFHSILTCRIVFNIRRAAVQTQTGTIVGLYSAHRDTYVGELRFGNPNLVDSGSYEMR